MKSARRKAFSERKSKKKKENIRFLSWKITLPAFLIATVFFIVKLNTHVWDGVNKVAFAYPSADNVEIVVMDPRLTELTTFVIPGETEVDVARNFGALRIKNVWQLGINENLGGNLLSETVTQNFLFPITLWTGKDPGLLDGSLKNRLSFVFFPGRTNIHFGDRLRIMTFASKVSELGKSKIDLKESKFLSCGKLKDGQLGCWIDGPISQRLTVYFSDNEIENKLLRVNISDETGTVGISEKLGEIIQVIGGKVVSINRGSSHDTDCVIQGKDLNMIKKISELFSCRIERKDSPFDLDIRIGKKFAERF